VNLFFLLKYLFCYSLSVYVPVQTRFIQLNLKHGSGLRLCWGILYELYSVTHYQTINIYIDVNVQLRRLAGWPDESNSNNKRSTHFILFMQNRDNSNQIHWIKTPITRCLKRSVTVFCYHTYFRNTVIKTSKKGKFHPMTCNEGTE